MGRGKQEETDPKKESWADKTERVEEHLTRGNRSAERTGGERLTTRETHFGDTESINADMRRIQIREHPKFNARQAGKGRHPQIMDRTTWTQPRHTRHGNMYQNPQNNNSKYPQHPHHNTWRKRNPEHKSSPNHIRDPKGPPRKPLADWNDAQPEEIGLSNLTLGPAYKARHPKQPHPGRDMRYAGWLGSAGHQATTHRAYDRHASLPTRDAPRPRTRAPNHTAYGQTMRGWGPSLWWNTRFDPPLSWRQSTAGPPTSPTGPCRLGKCDPEGPRKQQGHMNTEARRAGPMQSAQIHGDQEGTLHYAVSYTHLTLPTKRIV